MVKPYNPDLLGRLINFLRNIHVHKLLSSSKIINFHAIKLNKSIDKFLIMKGRRQQYQTLLEHQKNTKQY